MNTAAGRLVFKIEPPNHIDPRDLEDILATDELFLNYFNEFLALPTFPEALFFNKNTGWFEIVDGAKQKLSQKIKAAVRASKRRPRIYRAVNQHSFTNLPIIPLEENFDLAPEEIDTSFTVTTLNKEQGLRWIKDHRFPAFLQSDLYIEYRLAKILSQTNDGEVEKKDSVTIQLDYTPHPVKIRPEDIVEEEPEDDSEQLLRNMCVCMGEALPTETEAFLSRARLLEGTLTTSSTTDSRPISSLRRPDSGLGSLTRLSGDSNSSDEEVVSRLVVPSAKKAKSVTPRPNDVVCHTTESMGPADTPVWKRSSGGSVYITPSSGDDEVRQATYLEELERLASESVTKSGLEMVEDVPASGELVYRSVDEMSSVITGTVIKYMLAEFNDGQPEVYAHHKAVRDLIGDPAMRDYSLSDIDNASCEWIIDSPDIPQDSKAVDLMETSVKEETKTKQQSEIKRPRADSDDDSVLGSNDDYEEDRDDYFRKHRNKKFYPLNCKQGIDDFKMFLKGTPGERHWLLWIDIDRAKTLGSDLIDMNAYIEVIRDRYHKKGSTHELTLGTKQALNLIDSSQWTIEKLYSLQNKIAEPLLVYWAPRYIVKNQMKAHPDRFNADYKNQRSVRTTSARRQLDTHPEPRTSNLLPLRPKTCKPSIQTSNAEIEELYTAPTPKDFVWQPPETVTLPESKTPIGRRRTHAVESVRLCTAHAGGQKQRIDHEAKLAGPISTRPSSRLRSRPHSANVVNSSDQIKIAKRARPSTATGAIKSSNDRMSRATRQSVHTQKSFLSQKSQRTLSEFGGLSEAKTQSAETAALDMMSNASEESEFIGGQRMNALLKALNHEHESGLFFRKYIKHIKNMIWLACLRFWEETQEYHKLFYSKSLNKYQVTKKAREIYSHYITKTSECFIGCTYTVIQNIQGQLSPPYEELFDDAELYALEHLLQAWQSMRYKDTRLLHEVQTKSIVVNLETKSKLVINLQRKGFLRPGDLEPDEDPMENFEDPVYDESLFEEIPEDFKDFTLEKIIRTAIHLENFRQFLQSHFATMDLSCWMDIEMLRRMDPKLTEEADSKAKDIKQKYFNKKYFFGPNSPASKEGLDAMMKSIGGWGKIFPDRPDDELIIGAQDFVRDRLSLKWLPMFLASEQFAELIRPSQQMVDAAEALLLSRQRRSQRLQRMLEGRWVSSSKEIIAFRRSLLNPVISYQFQRFVCVKSDLLENDVLFWRECQKYKHLHHHHTDDSFIVQKINVIINCFIATSMETPLQLDIPQEQADRITEKKRELGPYIFREAQLTVFRVLFEHWADFCTFKSNTATEQILPTIERKRRRAKLRERQRQKELEEQQERENARRRALGLPVEGEDAEGTEPGAGGGSRQKGEAEEEEKSEITDGQKVAWSYSNYIDALEKEDVINRTSEDTFSCLSGESGLDKPSSAKPTVDVSDLKDLKAPQTDIIPEPEPEVKPASKKKKPKDKITADTGTSTAKDQNALAGKLKPSPPGALKNPAPTPTNQKPERKVAIQLDNINRAPAPSPVQYKPAEKSTQPMRRAIPPLIKK